MGALGRMNVKWTITTTAILGAVVCFGLLGYSRLELDGVTPRAATSRPIQVPLWVPPEDVVYDEGIVFAFDPPEALAGLRQSEQLDRVVAGATTDEERVRRLMRWTRSQFEPGYPSLYPPPDAMVILREIRAGRTHGFCAQYCFVLVQAAASFGIPARLVTIAGHEVTEAWLDDQQRWSLFDPMYRLQVLDIEGRSLSALEIRQAWQADRDLVLDAGHLFPGNARDYSKKFHQLAVWARNDFISRPLNFRDFERCRVWFDPEETMPPGFITTTSTAVLYSPPPPRP
jgi:hypothetical protein